MRERRMGSAGTGVGKIVAKDQVVEGYSPKTNLPFFYTAECTKNRGQKRRRS